MKTLELMGDALDWAVTYALHGEAAHYVFKHNPGFHCYSTNWAQGGPIIEREEISTCWEGATWVATLFKNCGATWYGHQYGHTPLIAAMRCYVASKLGDEIEIPEELK